MGLLRLRCALSPLFWVAGSGGYYVSCGADTIFADSATITASIGVVGGKLATNEMWESVGIHWHPIERGKNAGMLYSGDVFTDEQKRNLQSWMDEVYEVFQGHVVQARGDRLTQPIEELAGGRVFTGRQALERGLIGRLGTLSDAIHFAAKRADMEDYEVRVVPRRKASSYSCCRIYSTRRRMKVRYDCRQEWVNFVRLAPCGKRQRRC